MAEREFETMRLWIGIANSIQEKIEKYQLIANDLKQPEEIRVLAKKEVEYQEVDLSDFFKLVRSKDKPISNAMILKYFEGYTLEEAALTLNISYSTLASFHAEFMNFTKQYKYQTPKDNSVEFEEYRKNLEFVLNPKYETCCSNCGSMTTISQDIIKKVFNDESRKEKARARG